MNQLNKQRLWFPALAALLAAARLCHSRILWEGDAYPLAAARQMLFGKALYGGIWFDKPPLLPFFYLLSGARPGWILRLEDALYVLACCAIAYAFGRDLWSRREGLWAAGLLGFYLTFYLPSAVIPVASDLLMLAPHAAAVWMAYRRRAFWSGALAALAFWISPKGIFVAAACALWYPAGIPLMLAGWAAVSAPAVVILWSFGALAPYGREVWRWGVFYAGTPLAEPWKNGLIRTVNWMGFHAAAWVAAAWFLARRETAPGERRRWVGWLAVCAVGVAAGGRFFPRYYFLLLPALALMAARGFSMLGRARLAVAALLIIPFARFAPTYLTAASGAEWRDAALDEDGRAAAALIRARSKPGDTLLVWGYRPEILAYAGLPIAGRFLDSQPLTGVPADRYLAPSAAGYSNSGSPGPDTAGARAELAVSQPTFIAVEVADAGNPRLDIAHYPELRSWSRRYRLAARTRDTMIYELAAR